MSDRPVGAVEVTATRICFLVTGLAISAWAPLVPLAKARSGLDEAAFGLVLLCFGVGSLVSMPLVGLSAARFGIRRVILISVATFCIALPLLAVVAHPVALAAVLFFFGAGLGGIDVAMNLQAIAVERGRGRAMMSGFHGLYSAGGIAGASCVAVALSAGLDVAPTITLFSFALALAVAATARGLLPTPSGRPAAFVSPRGVVLLIGLLAAAAFLTEGAVLDWSAIFLASTRDVPMAAAGAGYVAFSIAMTSGRLLGDRIVHRFGGRRVLVAGATLAAAGIAIVAVVPSGVVAIAAFALVGIGASNVVPVLFSAAGRQTEMPESLAVPTMTTMGYAGLLAGPALIGFVAHATSLSIAFVGVAAAMLVVAACGRRLAV